MNDIYIDGNGVAGLLDELLAVDATSVERICQSCKDMKPLGAHRAYRGAGVVLRCPTCGDMAIRIGVHGERLTVLWQGTYRVAP